METLGTQLRPWVDRQRRPGTESLLSGAVEVTARLKCCDDLDLLVKVLEANRALFVKADRLAKEILTLSDEQSVIAPTEVAVRTAEAAAEYPLPHAAFSLLR